MAVPPDRREGLATIKAATEVGQDGAVGPIAVADAGRRRDAPVVGQRHRQRVAAAPGGILKPRQFQQKRASVLRLGAGPRSSVIF